MLKHHTMQPKEKEGEPVSSSGDQLPTAEIGVLAQKLFRRSRKKKEEFSAIVKNMYTKAAGKDFLVIHSPGGWGNTQWDDLLDWEKSIVTGVTATLEKLGYSCVVVQYFRSGNGWVRHMKDILKEMRFFFTGASRRAEIMAEGLKLVAHNLKELKIVLVGASQGAAFNNVAMQKIGHEERIYSLELGTFFPHMPRRFLTERTLAIDSNGTMRDPMCHRNLWAGTKSYMAAFYRWIKGQIQRKPMKFTHCINTPGHEYNWEYPAVHTSIEEFMAGRFGARSKTGR